jgi:hypothetical protein
MATKTKRKKRVIRRSPIGIARYPHVREARQFHKDGKPVGAFNFSTECVIAAADMEAFRKEALEAARGSIVARNIGDGTEDVALRCFKPFKGADDEVDPTKEISTFKKRRDFERDGGVVDHSPPPPVYDAAGVPMPDHIKLTPGSKIVVAWTPYVWQGENAETGKKFFGLSLNLEGIRVLELAPDTDGRSASDLGFDTDGPSIFGAEAGGGQGDAGGDDDGGEF